MADICPPVVPALTIWSAVLSTPPVRQMFQRPRSLRPPYHPVSFGPHPLPMYSACCRSPMSGPPGGRRLWRAVAGLDADTVFVQGRDGIAAGAKTIISSGDQHAIYRGWREECWSNTKVVRRASLEAIHEIHLGGVVPLKPVAELVDLARRRALGARGIVGNNLRPFRTAVPAAWQETHALMVRSCKPCQYPFL